MSEIVKIYRPNLSVRSQDSLTPVTPKVKNVTYGILILNDISDHLPIFMFPEKYQVTKTKTRATDI